MEIDVSNCKIFFKKYVCNHCKDTLDFDCEQCQKYIEYLKAEKFIKQLQQLKDYIKEDLAPTCQRLQKENDELKEELKTYQKMFDNEEFRVALTDIRTGERELWQKYKPRMIKAERCLDEIEEQIKDNIHCNCRKGGCEVCSGKSLCDKYYILQLIKQVKEGGE